MANYLSNHSHNPAGCSSTPTHRWIVQTTLSLINYSLKFILQINQNMRY
jgi:hypothetical protein